MGRQHSDLMMNLFPTQRGVGVDLGNVEIKECGYDSKDHKFVLKGDDTKSEFILFYFHPESEWAIVNTKEFFYRLPKKRSVTIHQVRKCAYFRTNKIPEMMDEIETIIKDTKFLGWILQPNEPGYPDATASDSVTASPGKNLSGE